MTPAQPVHSLTRPSDCPMGGVHLKQNLTILIPASDKATRDVLGGLTALYAEAVRCYIFGLNSAAMVLCRAIVEETLVRLYGISKTSDLKACIAEARIKVTPDLYRGLEMVRLKGNLVLHQPKPDESGISESDVLKALSIVTGLMDEATHYAASTKS